MEKSFPLIKIEGFESQKTLFFEIGKKDIKPGQFYMVNFYGCQKPFSISHYDGNTVGFTVQDRGDCSKKMINSKIGEYFGLTGPLGNFFDVEKYNNLLLIGGGIGTAPIYYLAKYLQSLNKNVTVIFGARNIENLRYSFDLQDQKNVFFYTDDGSYGKKGFVTMDLQEILSKNNFDSSCICGPEKMMKITMDILKSNIKNIFVSMERYMKCGVGLCGSCAIDDVGLRVCEDGPVFSYFDTLINCNEFGNYHRNGLGIIE
ncbi:MAG: hypothetical protein A2086_05675 [Spirochaetes bacterium GWD1_27_9]|nr:MAG: hypothetical protein A2Y34_08690 [Spirochaetes bacterium GWC1_27_15]OHD37635.1 MAG: hypothetical protein A2086_05675 [Spirochaetes bacterium GWD1_27_9]